MSTPDVDLGSRHLRSTIVAFVAVLAAGACGGSPASPSSAAAGPASPEAQSLPSIVSVTTSATRVEVDQDVDLTANLQAGDYPLDLLKFVWSANVGTVTGNGLTAKWRLAKGSPTPVDVTVTLALVEPARWRDGSGQVELTGRRVQASAPPVRVHDSVAELTAIGVKFLVDLFGNSNVSPDAALVDFTDSCPGKRDERSDIAANRDAFTILSASAHVNSIVFNADKTKADMDVSCTFQDRSKSNGAIGMAIGGCELTGVYEQRRWWLCDSLFHRLPGVASTPGFFGKGSF